jgi:hypothetical protein
MLKASAVRGKKITNRECEVQKQADHHDQGELPQSGFDAPT